MSPQAENGMQQQGPCSACWKILDSTSESHPILDQKLKQKFIFIIFMYVCAVCLYVHHMHSGAMRVYLSICMWPRAFGCLQGMGDSVGAGVRSHSMWVLGTKPGSYARAASAPCNWPISPATQNTILKEEH